MKVTVIADTHSLFSKMLEKNIGIIDKIKNTDLIILLGDHSVGDIRTLERTFYDMPKIGVLGNHDTEYTYFETTIDNIHKKQVYVNKLSFIGFQGSTRYKAGQKIGFGQEESVEIGMNLPPADILICHDAPYGYEGNVSDVAHCGMKGILTYIQHKAPKIVLYGHHHHNKWYKIDNTNCLCIYGIQIFEIDDKTVEIKYL